MFMDTKFKEHFGALHNFNLRPQDSGLPYFFKERV